MSDREKGRQGEPSNKKQLTMWERHKYKYTKKTNTTNNSNLDKQVNVGNAVAFWSNRYRHAFENGKILKALYKEVTLKALAVF